MIKIIVDAMGGDNAPQAIVSGCVDAVNREDGFQILLTGDEDQIQAVLKEKNYTGDRIEIRHTTEVVTNHDEPSKIVRRKRDSSMVVAFQLLKEGCGDAVLSCGSTGAMLACSVMLLKRIKGIHRPALGTLLPTTSGGTLLLDCGLNAECKPINYVQFGVMGSQYMKHLMGMRNPKVGLLNIGAEAEKGTDTVKEAYELLQAADLTFIGNVEGNDVINGVADVVVSDGFTGNVLLKSLEGTAAFFVEQLKQIFYKSFTTKLSALFVKEGIKDLKNKIDVDALGGAPILGVDGLVIKSHGNSRAKTIEYAVIKCYNLARSGMVQELKQEFEKRK